MPCFKTNNKIPLQFLRREIKEPQAELQNDKNDQRACFGCDILF